MMKPTTNLFVILAISALTPLVMASAVSAQTMRVDRASCAQLVDAAPADDVAYRPGVDAHGRAVAPADASGASPIQLPQTYETNVALNPMSKLSPTTTSGNTITPGKYANSSMSAGKVGYDMSSGQVSYNGQPLTNPQTAAMAKACHDAGYR